MKLFIDIVVGVLLGIQFGFLGGLMFASYLDKNIKQDNQGIIEQLITPGSTIAASAIAMIGVVLLICSKDALKEKSRRNKLIATRSLFFTTLLKLDEIIKNYNLKACHEDKFDIEISQTLTDSEMKSIKIVTENSNKNIQRNLGNLLAFYQIAVLKYEKYVSSSSHLKLSTMMMSDALKDLIVHLISLRSLIQCHYIYGYNGDFDNFKLDLNQAMTRFHEMLYTFESYNESTNTGSKLDELRAYAYEQKNMGFLGKKYVEKIVQNA